MIAIPLMMIPLFAAAILVTPKYQMASAYNVMDLPKNIDLNDASEETIRSYYSSLDGLTESELKGTNLLKNLKPILKKGQMYLSYGKSATTKVWQAYEITDRDWVKSPASEIAGYNAATNSITGYVYGKSASEKGSNPYIHALYTNRNSENIARAWDDHSQTNQGFNQEHVWPKSLGFDNDNDATGARGDLNHLWAGNGRVNGQYHSNYYYGFVDQTRTYKNAGDDYSYLQGNLRGYSKTLGGETTVFEPQDSDKGDIARAIFYMAARYNYFSGSDTDGINAGNPNLEIVNNLTSFSESGYTSTTSNTGKIGVLQDLLEWNKLDPVDEYEIHRNNILFNNYTKNRNPFIDFPQWADYIWGTSNNGTYNPTPTSYAKPNRDSINDSAITLSETSKTLKKEETFTLSATALGSGKITWTVDNPSVSVVSISKTETSSGESITVTALENGTAKITAKVTIGEETYTKTCTVTVKAGLSMIMLIAIGAAALLILIIVIIVLSKNAKLRKKVVKKGSSAVKKAVYGSSSGKKKSSGKKSSSSKSSSKKK